MMPDCAVTDRVLFRPIQMGDLGALLDMAVGVGAGFTSLPRSADVLSSQIQQSLDSFSENIPLQSERRYLFVLETLDKKKVIGVSGILSNVGADNPFYTFRKQTITQVSTQLNQRFDHAYLELVSEHHNSCELVSLFLDPAYRAFKRGQFLSRARWLFLSQNRAKFPSQIFAAMRGVCDAHTGAPFWDALCTHFFDLSFAEANYLAGGSDRAFISDLMPRWPIYIALLPEFAQKVIGQVHPETRGALAFLIQEGMQATPYLDVFDAGPILGGQLAQLYTVSHTHTATVGAIETNITAEQPVLMGVNNGAFRAMRTCVMKQKEGSIIIDQVVADQLTLQVGSSVLLCNF